MRMGFFGKKATLASMLDVAYRTKQTNGSCYVLADQAFSVSLTTYDQHQQILFELARTFYGKQEVPVRFAFDVASKYQPSVGVYFGDALVGWVKTYNMNEIVEILSGLPQGSSIVGHLIMDSGRDSEDVPYARARGWIYANIND
jgi:hypothetical protein